MSIVRHSCSWISGHLIGHKHSHIIFCNRKQCKEGELYQIRFQKHPRVQGKIKVATAVLQISKEREANVRYACWLGLTGRQPNFALVSAVMFMPKMSTFQSSAEEVFLNSHLLHGLHALGLFSLPLTVSLFYFFYIYYISTFTHSLSVFLSHSKKGRILFIPSSSLRAPCSN